jgi:hypothetical protein
MKKLLHISVALLFLISGVQLTISKHYCDGELADSKVSVLGNIATCGMETKTDECTHPSKHIESHCCDNQISIYSVDHNYSPSFFEFKAFTQNVLQVFILPVSVTSYSFIAENHFCTDVSPPVNQLVSDVNLPDIGVFRI